MGSTTWLIEIPPEECADLLAAQDLGRVAVVIDGRPEIFPVSHVYDHATGTVAFPTKPGTKLNGALSWPYVAFEVDGIDDGGRSGWSVAMVGRAEAITDPGIVERMSSGRAARWAAGEGPEWLRIVPTKVTGRRIRAVAR